MHVIPEQLWNQINVKTWKDLDPHLWECFRLALIEAITEEEVQGVIIKYTEVNKTNIAGLYEIKFIGTKGIPDNIEGLKQALDTVIPAHLGFKYTFTYNSWGMVSVKTWLECNELSWNNLRIWKEVS